MPIELRKLDQLDTLQVGQNLEETVTRIQEDNSQIDMRMGVFFSLLCYYHAVLATQRQANVNDYLSSRSLRVLEQNPELAASDLVDDVLSNYLITRRPGNKASGTVTIILSEAMNTVIAAGSVFESSTGLRFVTDRAFTAKLAEDHVIMADDRLLTATADGFWAFNIEIVAEVEGASSSVTKDSTLAPLTPPQFYLTSYAAGDFVGGVTPETNTELLTKLQLGIAGKAMSNRTQMQAMLRDVEAFSSIIGMSIVGYGDAEMLRDQHSIIPISFGGRVDWYVRSQEQVARQVVTKDATYIGTTALGYGIWQLAIIKTDAPGFYEIANIRRSNSVTVVGGFEILTETRAVDLTDTGFVPDIKAATLIEGIYSPYQTAVISFVDTATPTNGLSLGDKKSYQMELLCMPLIDDIQSLVNSREIRHHGADCLVKAPIPCFMTINFIVYKQTGEPDPDVSAIKNAICTEVNNIGFIGRLFASKISDIVHGYLHNATSLSAIDMHGRIRYPDGSIKYLRSSEVLVVPSEPAQMVSARTVQFFLSPDDIGISIETNVPTDF